MPLEQLHAARLLGIKRRGRGMVRRDSNVVREREGEGGRERERERGRAHGRSISIGG